MLWCATVFRITNLCFCSWALRFNKNQNSGHKSQLQLRGMPCKFMLVTPLMITLPLAPQKKPHTPFIIHREWPACGFISLCPLWGTLGSRAAQPEFTVHYWHLCQIILCCGGVVGGRVGRGALCIAGYLAASLLPPQLWQPKTSLDVAKRSPGSPDWSRPPPSWTHHYVNKKINSQPDHGWVSMEKNVLRLIVFFLKEKNNYIPPWKHSVPITGSMK